MPSPAMKAPPNVVSHAVAAPPTRYFGSVLTVPDAPLSLLRAHTTTPLLVLRGRRCPGRRLVVTYAGRSPQIEKVSHSIKSGDTLYSVAAKYNTTLTTLRTLNPEWEAWTSSEKTCGAPLPTGYSLQVPKVKRAKPEKEEKSKNEAPTKEAVVKSALAPLPPSGPAAYSYSMSTIAMAAVALAAAGLAMWAAIRAVLGAKPPGGEVRNPLLPAPTGTDPPSGGESLWTPMDANVAGALPLSQLGRHLVRWAAKAELAKVLEESRTLTEQVDKLENNLKRARFLVDRLRVGMSQQDKDIKRMRVRILRQDKSAQASVEAMVAKEAEIRGIREELMVARREAQQTRVVMESREQALQVQLQALQTEVDALASSNEIMQARSLSLQSRVDAAEAQEQREDELAAQLEGREAEARAAAEQLERLSRSLEDIEAVLAAEREQRQLADKEQRQLADQLADQLEGKEAQLQDAVQRMEKMAKGMEEMETSLAEEQKQRKLAGRQAASLEDDNIRLRSDLASSSVEQTDMAEQIADMTDMIVELKEQEEERAAALTAATQNERQLAAQVRALEQQLVAQEEEKAGLKSEVQSLSEKVETVQKAFADLSTRTAVPAPEPVPEAPPEEAPAEEAAEETAEDTAEEAAGGRPPAAPAEEAEGVGGAREEAQEEEEGTLVMLMGAGTIPHPRKVATGGEDAFFYSASMDGGGALGVADGVSGWAYEGVDPALYSRQFMDASEAAYRERSSRGEAVEAEAGAGQGRLHPQALMAAGYRAATEPGSATVAIAVLEDGGRFLHYATLGDAGVRVVRDGEVVAASTSQQYEVNMPFQLGCRAHYPESNSVEEANVERLRLQGGEAVVVASDGFFDNMFDEELVAMVEPLGRGGAMVSSAEVGDLARRLTEKAAENSQSSEGGRTPWARDRAEEQGLPNGAFRGGKLDDITVVLGYVDVEELEYYGCPPTDQAPAASNGSESNGVEVEAPRETVPSSTRGERQRQAMVARLGSFFSQVTGRK